MQLIPRTTPYSVLEAADNEVERVLAEGYTKATDLVARNRRALDALTEALVEREFLTGDEIREVVEKMAEKADLERRAAEKSVFM